MKESQCAAPKTRRNHIYMIKDVFNWYCCAHKKEKLLHGMNGAFKNCAKVLLAEDKVLQSTLGNIYNLL